MALTFYVRWTSSFMPAAQAAVMALACLAVGAMAQPSGGMVPGVAAGRPAPSVGQAPQGQSGQSSQGPGAQSASGSAIVFELPTQGQNIEEAFRFSAKALAQKLGAAPQWQSAYNDKQGRLMEGFFDTRDKKGQAVKGALLLVSGVGARVLLDLPQNFGRSHTQFVRAALAQAGGQGGGQGGANAGPQRPPQVLPLTPVNFGTGSVSLPQGWNILGSYQGCVEASAPNSYLVLGCPEFAAVPGAYPDPRVFQQAYGPLPTMLTAYLTRRLQFQELRILESTPAPSPSPNSQAAYFLFDYVLPVNGQAKPFRGLMLFIIMPTDNQTYSVYKSGVFLEREKFEPMFPTMWAAWKSWSVNPQVFKDRMDAALTSMRETSRIISGRSREITSTTPSADFDQYIRGVATVEDGLSRERREMDQSSADLVVAADPNRFRVVSVVRATQ